jgi:hypothetical protein
LTSIVALTFVLGFSTYAYAAPTEVITNGDFETGTFAGWSGGGGSYYTNSYKINNGLLDPPGPFSRISPIDGSFDAMGTQSSPSAFSLYQTITVPPSVVSAELSWDDRIRSGTTFRAGYQDVRMIIYGSGFTELLFSTSPSDPRVQNGPNSRSYDISALLQDHEGENITLGFVTYSRGSYLNWSLDDISLLIETNRAPDCSTAEPSLSNIWPPNHEMIDVSILGVTDADGDPVTITIDAITQDESVNGKGDGNTSSDGDGVGTEIAQVRAERSGNGDGRVYEIAFTASDGSGFCAGLVQVGVPHDKKDMATDSGQIFISTEE